MPKGKGTARELQFSGVTIRYIVHENSTFCYVEGNRTICARVEGQSVPAAIGQMVLSFRGHFGVKDVLEHQE